MENLIEKLKNIEVTNAKKPFSLLEILYQKTSRKEVAQSEMLAGLLRPTENHGHGSELIENFLAYIDVEVELQKESNLKIETERYANGRYIDLFISWLDGDQKHAVIIENKLNNAQNQPNALNDYHDVIVSEGYIVDRIVYMPFSKKWQKSENTDTRKDVLAKTIDFDAQDIVDWLDDFISENGYQNDECTIYYYETDAMWDYREFLECLISNQYLMQQAIEIQEKLSNEEIHKLETLAKIVNSNEWVEARFKKVSTFLKTKFENLQEEYFSDKPRAQYWFKPYKFFVEVWIKEKSLWLLVASETEEKSIEIANKKYDYDEYEEGYYYYYCKDNYAYTDIEKLQMDLVPILEALSNYKD